MNEKNIVPFAYDFQEWQFIQGYHQYKRPIQRFHIFVEKYIKYNRQKEFFKIRSQQLLTNFHNVLPPKMFHRQIGTPIVCVCGTLTSNDCYACDTCCASDKRRPKRKNLFDNNGEYNTQHTQYAISTISTISTIPIR